MYDFFKNLDRRWIFLMMFLSVAVPIIVIGDGTLPVLPEGVEPYPRV